MSDENDLHETIQTIVKRTETLDRLAHGPTNKRDLRDDLGVSRSTVYKAVGELEERQLVEQTGDGVQLTLYGRLLFENYQSFVETTANVTYQQELLAILPSDAPVTTDLLAGADPVLTEPHAPSKPLDYVEDLVLAADRVIGLGPVSFRRYVTLFHELLTSDGLTAEFVAEAPVVKHVREEYDDRFDEALELDNQTLWEIDESLPFGLLLVEGDRNEVALVVYDEDGKPVGAITNDSRAALDWGWDVFETFRSRATRVDEYET